MPEERFKAGVDATVHSWLQEKRLLKQLKNSSKQEVSFVSGLDYNFGFENLILENHGDDTSCNTRTKPLSYWNSSVSNGITKSSTSDTLRKCINCGHSELLREAITNGKINPDGLADEAWSRSILHLVTYRADKGKILCLLKYGALVNVIDKRKLTPIHLAASIAPPMDPVGISALLLDHGADINAQCEEGKTALHRACIVSNISLISFLLKRGADVGVFDKKLKIPIDYASKSSAEEIFNIFQQNAAFSKKTELTWMWAHLYARSLVSDVFTQVERACITCKRKKRECLFLKQSNIRYWLFVHGIDMH